jgi:AcrR family transcriptional regulator
MVYRRTPRSDDARAEARARLLDAARELFTRDGYEATTMQQIVAGAGTSIGNAYFYFPNKERLLAELVERFIHEEWDASEALAESVSPGPTRIGTIIYANVTSMLGHNRDLARLFYLTDRQVASVEIVRTISIARWLPHLETSYPDRSAEDRELAASAIFGANRAVVERVITGSLAGSATRVARRMVRWSLRALGATEPEIDATIRSAARRVSVPASTAKG